MRLIPRACRERVAPEDLLAIPAKPKIGVCATKADEIWYIGTSILRLLDGSRLYLHVVIDSY